MQRPRIELSVVARESISVLPRTAALAIALAIQDLARYRRHPESASMGGLSDVRSVECHGYVIVYREAQDIRRVLRIEGTVW